MNRRSPEAALQRSVVQFLDRALPHGWRYWHNHQNAPSLAAQKRLKALGVKAGVPDLFVCGRLAENDNSPGISLFAFELKSPKGRTTIEQEDWLHWFTHIGAVSAVARSIDDVEQTLKVAGVPLRATVGEG